MASNTNYKPLFIDKLEEFSKELPEYSLCEIIHSVLTQLSKNGVTVESKGDLLSITDKQLYSGICKSIKEEIE